MFKNILVPTDGSPRSVRAIARAVRLAHEQNARVTGVYVSPAYRQEIRDDMASLRYKSPQASAAAARRNADRHLREVRQTAAEFGVPCELVRAVGDRPYDEIVRTANRMKCDLICMASHGRTGLSKLLLGSQTSRVLALSKVPVMVVR
jgi:nucleotide-binding universal stress UspA family protein